MALAILLSCFFFSSGDRGVPVWRPLSSTPSYSRSRANSLPQVSTPRAASESAASCFSGSASANFRRIWARHAHLVTPLSQRLPVWMEKVPLTCLMPGIEGGVRSGLTGEVQYAVNGPWDLGRRIHLLRCGEGTACFTDQRGSFPNSVFNMCFRSSEFNQIVQSTFGD